MKKIIIDDCVYNIHPIFDLYAASKDGNKIHIIKQIPQKGNKHNSGYLICNVRKYGQPSQKTYYVHRFIWECWRGIIPNNKEIDHKNDIKDDNRLSNLQLLTGKQNCKKAAASCRDYKLKFKNRKCVKATNENTNEVSYYYSLYATHKHFEINSSCVYKVCEGVIKSTLSKKDGHVYKFEYIEKEELPDNYIQSPNIRPRRVSDEDKRKHRLEWWNKEYKCPKCGVVTKNYSPTIMIFLATNMWLIKK